MSDDTPTAADVLGDALGRINAHPQDRAFVTDELLADLSAAGFRVIRPDPDRVNTDPVVVSCAVRYALGRLSYLPGMIADEVRRTWPHLGHQSDVIAKDITEWLAEPWRHDQRPGFEDTVTVWSDLAAWIDRQIDTDTGRTDDA